MLSFISSDDDIQAVHEATLCSKTARVSSSGCSERVPSAPGMSKACSPMIAKSVWWYKCPALTLCLLEGRVAKYVKGPQMTMICDRSLAREDLWVFQGMRVIVGLSEYACTLAASRHYQIDIRIKVTS